MKYKAGITKKDVVVLTGCVVFLVMTVGAVNNGGRFAARRGVCLSNIRQQSLAQFAFAGDNDGEFSPNNGNGPGYHRSNIVPVGVERVRVFDQMYGSYITDTDIMFCPLLKKLGDVLDKRFYAATGYGGWDIMDWSGISAQGANWDPSGGPPPYVLSGYCWFANFRQHPNTVQVIFYDDEFPWPKNLAECSSEAALISHEISSGDTNTLYWDLSHGGGWDSYGLPIEAMQSSENPVGYSDGHIEVHKKNVIKPRANTSRGGNYYFWY